ncbi:MAG: 4-alpha-glucanotransferase [Thomasclavelia sp.]|nr:4-alpha-glucanotransferase [Thomasclavelia sp.]
MKYDIHSRQAGIILPMAALPSNSGIGDFGNEAKEFVKIISKMGFKIWQILPLNPSSDGNSPYTPFSSFAIDEIYIDINALKKNKLITKKSNIKNTGRVQYDQVRSYKRKKLEEAFNAFKSTNYKKEEYKAFTKEAFWLDDYALYMALKYKNKNKPWDKWNKQDKDNPSKKGLTKIINYHKFVQFIAFEQFKEIHTYAKKHEVTLLGDLPFYVGYDSSDVYNNKKCFDLDENELPVFVSGASPDYFNADGQLWNHPTYDWKYLKDNNYKYWVDRFKWTSYLFDVIRIDHFRAIDTYWQIPYGETTARNGHYEEGPSYSFMDSIFNQIPHLNMVVEDLGDIRPEVEQLRDAYDLMGMKVIQYCFDQDYAIDNYRLPKNCIVYTGTHDNAPLAGWYNGLLDNDKERIYNILRSFNYPMYNIDYLLMYHVFATDCDIAITQVQDILGRGNEARYNLPGTISDDNWTWRLEDFEEFKGKHDIISEILKRTSRV